MTYQLTAENEHLLGIHGNMSNEDYHTEDGISNSRQKLIGEKCPAYVKWLEGNPKDPTDAMVVGTGLHTAVLEPEKFNDLVAVEEFGKRNTKKYADFAALHEGKLLLNDKEFDLIQAMRNSVFNDPVASLIFSRGYPETSIFADDDGLLRKIRPDWRNDSHILFDLKSCTDASEIGVRKAIYNFGYDQQAAFYMDTYELSVEEAARAFILVCVEKTAPYLVGCWMIPEEMIEKGRIKYKANLATLRKCIESDKWPGYTTKIETLGGWNE